MKVLFVHQNFPGQFLYLAPALRARGHDCKALTDAKNKREASIPILRYRHDMPPPDPGATRLGRNFTQMTDRAVTVARACLQLRDKHGYAPDVIFGHSGWGETLFLKEVWPDAKLIVYAEFYYRGVSRDVGFDPEFSRPGFDPVMSAQSRAAHLGQSLLHADAAIAPTKWQASTYPAPLRPMIEVIFDGVNTAVMTPNPQATLTVPNGKTLRAGDEVLTFVNRNLEPYRGYHSFMRALPDVMSARPEAEVVIVGGDDVSYGAAPPKDQTWKQIFLDEVKDRLDLSRVHFLGKVPYPEFVALMQISRVHAYFTYPFVLSWSMLEAMSAGAYVIGSRSPPVEELIEDGVNGRLVDFFDIKSWSAALIEGLAEPERFMPLRKAARQTILDGYDLHRVCMPRMVDFVESFAPQD
ncbi:glycosyltransferase [Pseudorhodobacter sp.]|uniref:glycosyltransferase n=1 Tax=Pseudorhodobacter sp. TaxID=1934400 RepID=UPI002649B22F|nr:glycosyltransferase [Pseudorhodobacter sp.]MDN5787001.1 glycosyltransferase [Pseudorhodobacter sp.]